jgi:hypothetical protein
MIWQPGASNGGTAVIDYTISYDQSISQWIELVSGVTETYYTTTEELIPGRTYTFKIQARNTVGLSIESTELSILAA